MSTPTHTPAIYFYAPKSHKYAIVNLFLNQTQIRSFSANKNFDQSKDRTPYLSRWKQSSNLCTTKSYEYDYRICEPYIPHNYSALLF